jgi:hypothetical protein
MRCCAWATASCGVSGGGGMLRRHRLEEEKSGSRSVDGKGSSAGGRPTSPLPAAAIPAAPNLLATRCSTSSGSSSHSTSTLTGSLVSACNTAVGVRLLDLGAVEHLHSRPIAALAHCSQSTSALDLFREWDGCDHSVGAAVGELGSPSVGVEVSGVRVCTLRVAEQLREWRVLRARRGLWSAV